MAVLAQMYAGAHTKKGKSAPKVSDFMYIDGKSKSQKQTKSFLQKLRAKSNAN